MMHDFCNAESVRWSSVTVFGSLRSLELRLTRCLVLCQRGGCPRRSACSLAQMVLQHTMGLARPQMRERVTLWHARNLPADRRSHPPRPHGWLVVGKSGLRPPQTTSLAAPACGDSARCASVALGSTGLAASAKRVRDHSHRGCLSVESAANAASSAMRPQDRAPQGSLRVQRQTATVKRRALSPRASAAPLRKRVATHARARQCNDKPTSATRRKQP